MTNDAVVATFTFLEGAAKRILFIINEDKTKIMFLADSSMDLSSLMINNYIFESVQQLKYLFSTFTSNDDMKTDTKNSSYVAIQWP